MNLSIISRKIVLALALFFLFLTITPAIADCPDYKSGDPIVFCGNEGQDPCTFDDLFCLINRVITFIMFSVVPPLAVIWFAFGGITMMTAGGDPSKIQTGKKMITYGIIGVLVVYAAWLIVYEFVYFLTGGDPWPLNFFQNPTSP